MDTPTTYPYQSTGLRAFIRSTSTSSAQLVYVPPSPSQMTLPSPEKSATMTRSQSAHPQDPPLRHSNSFSNLLNVFRRPSLSFSAETLSTRASDSIDLDARHILVDPHIPYPATVAKPAQPAVPPRLSSLSWLQDACPETPTQSDRDVQYKAETDLRVEDPLELQVAAELRQTFKEWEERFGLGRVAEVETMEHLSPTLLTSPASPTDTHLLTPAPILFDDLNPLRSQFSCDSDDDERAAVRDLINPQERIPVSPGSIGRLTRKMSSVLTFGISQKSPLGRRVGLGRRGTTQ